MTIKRFELCANEVDCYHITDLETGKRYNELNLEKICALLNSLDMTATNVIEALDVLKEENNLLKNSEAVTDQKELQKLIFQTIINMIDEKLNKAKESYSNPLSDSKYYKGQIEVLQELKKELKMKD